MRRTDPKSVAEIIEDVLRTDGNAAQLARQRASYAWCEVVGQGVNRYTTRRYVENTTLHVFITSAPLKHELSFHRSRIVEEINRAVGQNVITEIVIH